MVATIVVGWYGFGSIGAALLTVGGTGFALFCAWQVVTMALLGICWRTVAPLGGLGGVGAFVWGRIVRDSAGTCLPFSLVGGFAFGVRAAAVLGISASVATLSLVVDLTAEFLAEILFAILGPPRPAPAIDRRVLDQADRHRHRGGARRLRFDIADAEERGALFRPVRAQDPRRLVRRPRKRDAPNTELDLAALYGNIGRTTTCTIGHLAGWLCKGIGNWIAFRLMGADIDLVTALAIEALLHALLIPAFIVPGYVGVQEVGYAGIGAMFGIPPEISLGVSLLRRARDIAIGVPVLLIWQLTEMRRLHKSWQPNG
ncbi:MAG: lysylphosphatidylglycerol synthase domain-containing protein [Aliidongia sp.]